MNKLLLFGMLLLFSVVVAADSTWEAGDEMVIDRANEIMLWTIDPCIDRNIQNNTNMSLKVYGVTCAYVRYDPGCWGCGDWRYRLRCDDIAFKISVWNSTDALVVNDDWIDYEEASRCWHTDCFNDDPGHTRNIYFPTDVSQTVTAVAAPYVKFANNYDGSIQFFAYVPPFDNVTKSGYLNATFNVNTTGEYTVKVYMKDTQNSSIAWDTQTINFSVTTEGVVSGQCNSTNFAGSQPTENPVTEIFGSWNVIVWFLLMIIVGVGLLIVARKNIMVGVGITIFAELIMLLMGTWLHIISPLYLLILGLLLAVVATIAIRKVFFA